MFENGLRRGNVIGTGIGVILLENWIAGGGPSDPHCDWSSFISVERRPVSDKYTILNQDSSNHNK